MKWVYEEVLTNAASGTALIVWLTSVLVSRRCVVD